MTHELLQQVCDANRALPASGLVQLTWGNVSGFDPESRLMCIKPSGVPYDEIWPQQLVILDLDGKPAPGSSTLRPSTDTATHLHLYRTWPQVRAIVHTHSLHATMFAQAGRDLPCLGTTHADHFHGTVPLARALTAEEIEAGYEHHTGVIITEHFAAHGIDPAHMPAVLLHHHAPFTWGRTPQEALDNALALELCARMALGTWTLEPGVLAIPQHISEKHHLRKHGPDAYYGQK